MGASKIEIHTSEQNHIASLAKALAHPARIAILQYVADHDQCVCGDLVAEIGLSQPTISQHLRELKAVNLLRGEIYGPGKCYCIDQEALLKYKNAFSILFNSMTVDINECC